jgi:hypothetical protein
MKRIIGVQQEIDGFYIDGEEGRDGAVYISTCGSILISVEAKEMYAENLERKHGSGRGR